jgi:UDP:flavonoid glycosyltransferase YjiC (YdhE family)
MEKRGSRKVNILITALGSYGAIYPMVRLGDQLMRCGHEVTLLINPFFEKLAKKYSLNFIPIGTLEQCEQFTSHPALFDLRKSLSVFFGTLLFSNIRNAYERLCVHTKSPDTVIVSSITVFSIRQVQEKFHIPNITVHLISMAFKSAYEMPNNALLSFPDRLPLNLERLYRWVADKAVVDRLICPELNAYQKELGLPLSSHILTKWGYCPQMVIGLFLIVFMPGSLMKQADWFFMTAIQSCQELGRRAILLFWYKQHVPSTLPRDIQHFKDIPLWHILPRADALVPHGGIGTCVQAF